MKVHSRIIFITAIFACGLRAQNSSPAGTASSSDLLYNLLIQKVCVDASDLPIAADPISCTGHWRALRPGEPLPYHRYDQIHDQQHDSYPLPGPGGALLVNNPFNYAPFDHFRPDHGGYDLYEVHDGWASSAETRDGGGFSTTFFGTGCKPYGGWVFFPASAVHADGTVTAGETYMPIAGNYWEQNGEPWPGRCPPELSRTQLTSWETVHDFPFGGMNGNPVRKLTAVRSVHGLSNSETFRMHGHLEVFYFTVPYGMTRWEVWTSKTQVEADSEKQSKAAQEQLVCNGSPLVKYHGQEFIVTACRDWSSIEIEKNPARFPFWPIPSQNLLLNFHFGENLKNWQSASSTSGLKLTLQNSNRPLDSKHIQEKMQGKGVRYLRLECTQTCNKTPALWQDIPLPASPVESYSIAATLRTEAGEGDVRMELLELNSDGKVLARLSDSEHVGSRTQSFDGDLSISRSATFIVKTAPLPLQPDARTLRWSLQLLTPTPFDLLDTWLAANDQTPSNE